MKSKAIIKFQINEILTSLIYFYIIFFAVEAIMIISSNLINDSEGFNFNGGDISSLIYIFVIGLMMFKKPMNFFTAHGVSRKTAVKSFFMTGGLLSFGMAVIDIINFAVIGGTGILKGDYNSLYGTRFGKELSMKYIPEFFIYQLLSIMFFIMLAYFIGVLFYRLPTKVKIGILAGAFVLVFLAPLGIIRLPEGLLQSIEKFLVLFYKHILIDTMGNLIFKVCAIFVFGIAAYLTATKASFSDKT
ncbi:MAG: hypothetical protein WC900_03280 [Oscillospiraceae bacterium]|jgi:hypothetical protein